MHTDMLFTLQQLVIILSQSCTIYEILPIVCAPVTWFWHDVKLLTSNCWPTDTMCDIFHQKTDLENYICWRSLKALRHRQMHRYITFYCSYCNNNNASRLYYLCDIHNNCGNLHSSYQLLLWCLKWGWSHYASCLHSAHNFQYCFHDTIPSVDNPQYIYVMSVSQLLQSLSLLA